MKKVLALMLALLLCGCAFAESEDWYLAVAKQHAGILGELVNDEAYLKGHSYNCLEGAKEVDFSTVISAYRVRFDEEAVLNRALRAFGMEDCSNAVREKHLGSLPSLVAASVRNAQGADAMAAATLVRWSETFVRPLNFCSCIYVLELDGLPVITTFSRTGDDTITVESAPLFTSGKDMLSMKAIHRYLLQNWALKIEKIM